MKRQYFLILLFLIAINICYGQSTENRTSILGVNLSSAINNTSFHKLSSSICDTTFLFKTTPIPSGLTWDGQNFWYVDTAYIYKVSSTGIYLDSIINPSVMANLKGGGLTYDGINLWYADEQSAQLFKINPSSKNILQQINLPSYGESDPNGFGLSWDGNNIWHSQYLPSKLYKLNSADGAIIDSFTTTAGLLGIEWVSGKLYGIRNEQIYKINPTTGVFQDSISWCVPYPLGLTWDGSYLYNVSGQDPFFGVPTGGLQSIYKVNLDFVLPVSEHVNGSNHFEIFPNPTTGNISVTGKEVKKIEIYSVTGNLVYSIAKIKQQVSTEINLSNFPKGIYFAKIYDEEKIYTEKIVIQ